MRRAADLPVVPDASGDVAGLLRDILDELRAVRAALGTGRQLQPVPDADRELLRQLLPAIGGLVGSSPFRVAEILADAGIRAVLGSLSPSGVGALLARLQARPASMDTR